MNHFQKISHKSLGLLLASFVFIITTTLYLFMAKNYFRIPLCVLSFISSIYVILMGFRTNCIDNIIHTEALKKHVPSDADASVLLRKILDNNNQLLEKGYTETLENTRAEISALQSQINPHFLYNTLDSIRGQALINGSTVIANMTEALSILFRYSISDDGKLATFSEELRCVDKYLMIQQFRFANKFKIVKSIDPSLLECLIPRLTLQPIVENSIFHGLETKEKDGEIKFQLSRFGNNLIFKLSDNGVGMNEEALRKINAQCSEDPEYISQSDLSSGGSGIAMKNISRRIRLKFGNKYGITVYSAVDQGTDVEIMLPILYKNEKQQNGV